VVVVIPGRPPSPNKRRAHFMAQHRDQAGKGSWKERAWMLAQSARNEAGWDLPVRTDPPTPRYLEIETYRKGLLDPADNSPFSLKAILDGLKGVLIVDDAAPRCVLLGPVQPHKVKTEAEERTVIRVYREDPR
jgi:hypothetical protein